MDISSLLKHLFKKSPIGNPQSGSILYKNIHQDHRTVEANDIFVAIRGASFDGHTVLAEVCKKNPAALIVEDATNIPKEFHAKTFVVTNTRVALDILAHAHFGNPSEKLFCIGITGTNGKTTVSNLIEYALDRINIPTGVIGTIDHHLVDTSGKLHKWDTQLTSPRSLDFYSRLNDFAQLGALGLAAEVSSHALEQDRMSSCQFDGAVFTNLSRDHLDYHKDMDAYFAAKQKLFTEILLKSNKKDKFAIINTSNEYGKKIVVDKSIRKITFGFKNADLTFEILEKSFVGQTIAAFYQNQKATAVLRLCGTFNAMNVLSAVAILLARGIPLEAALLVFENFKGVPGRMQKVANTEDVNVFVDYAHTPDALENVLSALNESKRKQRLITVFGCGGDRDKGKRPYMGRAACKFSDHVIITSDNPRNEDPKKIIDDAAAGCIQYKNFKIEIDRAEAIRKALMLARTGDAVLIAGKGHETYQIIGDQKIHFDDAEIVQEFFTEKKAKQKITP